MRSVMFMRVNLRMERLMSIEGPYSVSAGVSVSASAKITGETPMLRCSCSKPAPVYWH